MKKQYLNGRWTLENEKLGEITAQVPGCVHTDLMDAGLIKDIYYRDNKKQYDYLENENFTYKKTFDAIPGEEAKLVFEGLDTYATVILNGEIIGEAYDMFHPYVFDVSGKLKEKDNTLSVSFRSPVKEVEGLPLFAGAFTRERIRTRRIQCTYGWDWVDRFVTAGIYRPVYIKYGSDLAVESAYIVTESIDKFSAGVRVELNFENYSSGALTKIEILSPSKDLVAYTENYVREPKLVVRFDIENPELWYPMGHGEHPLYTLRVTAGENVHSERFGIRSVKILQLVDKPDSEYSELASKLRQGKIGMIKDRNEISSGFQLIVNGERIFCMGANFVPTEPFPSAETDERFSELISRAVAMGVNMIRVWGGGLFEKDSFYTLCDEAGILICHDFLMACGTYPEKEDWFIKCLSREAEYAAKLLRNHPSLVWWHGDNENAVNGSDDMEDHIGRDSARRGIAPVIYELDPERQFLPSSPWGGKLNSSITRGTTHNTNFIGHSFVYFKDESCKNYREYLEQFLARFISEEPTFGAVSKRSAGRFLSESDLTDESEEMIRFHTKTNPCLKSEIFDMITAFAKKIFGAPKSDRDRYFEYEYIQYEWIRIVFENQRRNIGYSNGLIFWMLNDIWPAALGWSLIDYYLMPKAAYYSFRRLAKDVIGSLSTTGDNYSLTVSNVREREYKLKSRIYELTDDDTFSVSEKEITVSPYSKTTVDLGISYERNKIIVADISGDGIYDRAYFFDGIPLLCDADDNISVTYLEGCKIKIKAKKYTHAVYLVGDADFSDNLFALLPGEEKTVTYRILPGALDGEISAEAYTIDRYKDRF